MYKNTEKHKLHFAQKSNSFYGPILSFYGVTLGPGVILAVCGRILMRFSFSESYLKCKFNELRNEKDFGPTVMVPSPKSGDSPLFVARVLRNAYLHHLGRFSAQIFSTDSNQSSLTLYKL